MGEKRQRTLCHACNAKDIPVVARPGFWSKDLIRKLCLDCVHVDEVGTFTDEEVLP